MDTTLEPKALIRKMSIDMITDTPNYIIDWFNDLWSQMHIVQADVFYDKGGEFIYYKYVEDQMMPVLFLDIQNEKFWCSQEYYWDFFDKNGVEYNKAQIITHFLMENNPQNKLSIGTPSPFQPDSVICVKLSRVLESIYSHEF